MYEPIFELRSFDSLPVDDRKHLIGVGCEFLIAVNRCYLRRNPNTPKFYAAAPMYELKERPFGIDRWQDIPQVLALRSGDCKDFVAYRVAELREDGCPDCGPRIIVSQAPGIISYHVQVRIDDKIEDPSKAMGMPKNLGASQLKKLFTNGGSTVGAQVAGGPPVSAAELQHLLDVLGAMPRVLQTGRYDGQTAWAIASFQKRVGLPVTGRADSKTVYYLRNLSQRMTSQVAGFG